MKKILFVINTMGRAGAERALIALINTLPKEEYDISLMTMINRGELYDDIPPHVHILKTHPDSRSVLSFGGKCCIARHILCSFFYRFTGFTQLGYLFKNLFAQIKKKSIQPDKLLWRILAKGTKKDPVEYDLAVAYLEGASTYYVADSVTAKKKAAFIHIDYKKAGYTRELDLDAYEKIDRIFSVSRESGESFLSLYPEKKDKLFLFRNIIDTEWIKEKAKENLPAKDPFCLSQADFKLLTVGRLHYQKAYDIAIPALKIIRERGYNVDWFILGEGSEQKALEQQIRKEGLQEHFHLLGSKENPYPYYKQATLYVHATRFEGKSIAIEEAQVLGKAIIASDCTGNREQITSKVSGLLIPLTKEAIADAVIQLLTNPDERKYYEMASQSIVLQHKEDFNSLMELLKNQQ